MRTSRTFLTSVFTISLMLFAASSFAGVWEDNFNDGAADGWNEIFGVWSVENGAYHRTDVVADYGKSINSLTGLASFTVEVDVTIVEKGAGNVSVAAGMLLRTDDAASAGYRFWIRGDANGFQYSVWKDNKFTNLIANVAEVAVLGQMYRLKVQLEDFTFSAWVDDRIMVDSYVDADQLFVSGQIGLINYNCHCLYDNLKISGDSIAAVAAGGKLATTWADIKD